MRHVYPTHEIPHLWAHQRQSYARNPQGNLYFEGSTIYSYGGHYPLATLHIKKRHDPLALINSRSSSSTTNGHKSAVRRACSHLARIDVPEVRGGAADHAPNIGYLRDTAAEALDKARRALTQFTVTWQEERAKASQSAAEAYCAFFGVRRKLHLYDAAAWDLARERIARIVTPDPVRDAKRLKARVQRQAVQSGHVAAVIAAVVAARGEHVAAWRLGAAASGINYSYDAATGYYKLPRSLRWEVDNIVGALPVMLRVKGDTIETSRGATIPLGHAPRIWRVVQACRSTGRPYEHNGHSEHAGEYRIDFIGADGTLRAGCHTIAYDELRALAAQLGLEGVQ